MPLHAGQKRSNADASETGEEASETGEKAARQRVESPLAPRDNPIDLSNDSDDDDDDSDVVIAKKDNISISKQSNNGREHDEDNVEEEDGENDDDDDDDDDDDNDDDDDDDYHHPGDLEIDYDSGVWDDWDERCHGPIDSQSNRREYPDGFVWSCCDKQGDEGGCIRRVGTTIEERYPDSSEPDLDETEAHHPGELEVDYDSGVWDDWDERCHGPIDSRSNRKNYSDGFVWS